MMIEMISAINSASTVAAQSISSTTNPNQNTMQGVSSSQFLDWVSNEIAVVNKQVNTAELNLREFAAGRTDNLHQVMLSLNKARMSFELMVEVRNRTLEGYQQIMRMQI